MIALLLAYGLSGFISLGYQVIWFRTLTDAVGATPVSFAIVVTGFIGGLAAGGLFSHSVVRAVSRLPGCQHPLRAYGVIEVAIAAVMVLTRYVGETVWVTGAEWPYVFANGIWEPTAALTAWQLSTGILSVFAPCFLMGTTFPLLARLGRLGTNDRWPSALYAANTFGAGLGVLACQFLLLRTLGTPATLWSLVAANVALGGVFLGWGQRFKLSEFLIPAAPPKGAAPEAVSTGEYVLLGTVTGLLAGALEGDLFRRITFVVELNPAATAAFVSFWCILGIFAASLVVHRWSALSRRHIAFAVLIGLAVHQLGWYFVDPLMDAVEANIAPAPVTADITLEGTRNLIFPGNLLQLWIFTGALVFVPYLLFSLGLPLACDRLRAAGKSVDLVYGLNALAFCIGLLAFTLAAPRVNVFYALKLFPLAAALIALWLLFIRPGIPWNTAIGRGSMAVLVAALAAAVLLVPREFERGFFRDDSQPARLPVSAVKSDGVHTTFVVTDEEIHRLYFGRLSMSSDNYASQVYMRLMAHFPLLSHPRPERALLICFGVGNTASAIASHPGIQGLDIVDLNPQVFATAGEFPANQNVIGDSRVRLIHDDGRQFLRRPGPRYDLITSEPPPPLAAGVDRLYTREYYESIKARLTPNGFMTQWLPLHMLSPDAVDWLVETFTASFPHVLLFTGFGTDFVLVGSLSPIELANIESRFPADGELLGELKRVGVSRPEALIARVVQGDRQLREQYRGGRVLSDARNDLEQLLPVPGVRPVIAYDPRKVWADIEGEGFRDPERIRETLMHLGRLRYRVQNFPFESLATVPREGLPPVALSGVDWNRLAELSRRNLAGVGPEADTATLLTQFLAESPEQPEVLLALADLRLQDGRLIEAGNLLQQFLALEPQDPAGTRRLAQVLKSQRSELP